MAALRAEGDRGVGDTIARLVRPLGGETFKVAFKRVFGFNCGCDRRQETLNMRWPYPPVVAAGQG